MGNRTRETNNKENSAPFDRREHHLCATHLCVLVYLSRQD